MKILNIIAIILGIIAFITIIAEQIYELYRCKKIYNEIDFEVKEFKKKLKDKDGRREPPSFLLGKYM